MELLSLLSKRHFIRKPYLIGECMFDISVGQCWGDLNLDNTTGKYICTEKHTEIFFRRKTKEISLFFNQSREKKIVFCLLAAGISQMPQIWAKLAGMEHNWNPLSGKMWNYSLQNTFLSGISPDFWGAIPLGIACERKFLHSRRDDDTAWAWTVTQFTDGTVGTISSSEVALT